MNKSRTFDLGHLLGLHHPRRTAPERKLLPSYKSKRALPVQEGTVAFMDLLLPKKTRFRTDGLGGSGRIWIRQ